MTLHIHGMFCRPNSSPILFVCSPIACWQAQSNPPYFICLPSSPIRGHRRDESSMSAVNVAIRQLSSPVY